MEKNSNTWKFYLLQLSNLLKNTLIFFNVEIFRILFVEGSLSCSTVGLTLYFKIKQDQKSSSSRGHHLRAKREKATPSVLLPRQFLGQYVVHKYYPIEKYNTVSSIWKVKKSNIKQHKRWMQPLGSEPLVVGLCFNCSVLVTSMLAFMRLSYLKVVNLFLLSRCIHKL